jgi:hypothetical protein
MFVTSISIRREDYYGSFGGGKMDPSKPFLAQIEVLGSSSKVELCLSPEMSARIVEIISDEVAAAGRATAEAMVAQCLTVEPSLAIEGAK